MERGGAIFIRHPSDYPIAMSRLFRRPEMQDPSRLTATAAAGLIRNGRLHPKELMEACLARIAAREPTVRAFAWLDPPAARKAATSARSGSLHGLPIGVKDVLDTSDMPSEYGSPIWRGWRPRADAAAVAWARAAGAIVIGKTVTTEFATRKPGPTTNPARATHTPGGSSSGSAAGVADFFFPLAFGTQTAGSVIRPAAYCGVVGFKPTFGLINRAGVKLMSDSLDTVGVIARSVADCPLFAGAVAAADLGDLGQIPPRPPCIGLCRSPSWDHAAPETVALFAEVAARLGRAGASLADRELPEPIPRLVAAHPIVMNAESARAMGWELAHARAEISAELLERLEFGLAQSPAALADARAIFVESRRAFPASMEGLDILLTPSAPGEAPEGLGSTGDPVFNFLWTSLHVPCVTVPAGTGPRGLPLGIQIVGPAGEDRATLAWAAWVEAVLAG
jgi:Asp-tRNA(Asn)/Glu-tRNA(Gln) amidotransferase A subunit family amidase